MKELDSFTVERLEEILNFDLPRHPAALEEIVALARIALAAKRAEPNELVDAVNEFLAVLDNYPEQLVPINRNSVPVKDLRKALSSDPQLNSPEIPDGWPTEDMVIAGFESGAWDALSSAVLKRQGWPYSCRESAECVTGIFKAMIAAAPEKP